MPMKGFANDEIVNKIFIMHKAFKRMILMKIQKK